MGYPNQHQYLTVIGDSYGSTERWQFGLRISDGGVSNQVTAEAVADDIEAWWRGTTGYVSSTQFLPSSTHRLTELKCARIGTDGQYPDGQASYSHFYLPPIAGLGTPPAGQTPQSTVAVTLTTAVPRGLASKGRIFLPPSQRYQPATADGLLSTADATSIRQSIIVLINAINANTEVGNVQVFSRGKGEASYNAVKKRVEYTYPNTGAVNNVTGVRVGRVVDTQRRRRRSLAEQPVAASL